MLLFARKQWKRGLQGTISWNIFIKKWRAIQDTKCWSIEALKAIIRNNDLTWTPEWGSNIAFAEAYLNSWETCYYQRKRQFKVPLYQDRKKESKDDVEKQHLKSKKIKSEVIDESYSIRVSVWDDVVTKL